MAARRKRKGHGGLTHLLRQGIVSSRPLRPAAFLSAFSVGWSNFSVVQKHSLFQKQLKKKKKKPFSGRSCFNLTNTEKNN